MNNQPLKILHICSYTWESGGVSSFIYNHANFQAVKGVETTIANCLKSNQTTYNKPKNTNIIEFRPDFLSRFLADLNLSLLWWFIKNRRNFDIIHVHGLWNAGSILAFLIPNKLKKIISVHGFLDSYVFNSNQTGKQVFWKLFQKKWMEKATVIQSMTLEEDAFLRKTFPEKNSSIVFIPNGLNDPLNREKEGFEPDFQNKIIEFKSKADLTLLFLGRINTKKGLDLLLDAFQKIKERNHSINLIVAGPKDNYSSTLENRAKSFSKDELWIVDLVKGGNKDELLRQADIFVFPSYSEGFSIAALEAIAFGKACILSNKTGFPEKIQEYQAGIICEPNSQSLLEAIQKIVEEPDLKREIEKNSRKLFLEHYQFSKIGEDFFQKILLG